ncbi:protein translocase subunit SecD [Candidatus Hepatobacter penaei]|uniref:protein translocase subunit SecD n=1 Tax=Candidatus Hepatobacter penaei TaxID=1274402 RepID=UPI0004F2B541|nr:protein translocase subunit SecD [Candidatus Hepatobacter penaei]
MWSWRRLSLLVVTSVCLVLSLPALMGPHVAARVLPSFLRGPFLTLGLDLQGGAHLLLEIDQKKMVSDHYSLLMGSLRRKLRDKECRYAAFRASPTGISFELLDDKPDAFLLELLHSVDGALRMQRTGETVHVTLSEESLAALFKRAQEKSIETIRRRVDETGTKEPVIQAQGDRILLQVPGADDPERVKALVGKTARLTFQLVQNVLSLDEMQSFVPSPGDEILFSFESEEGAQERRGPNVAYVVQKEVLLSGDMLVDAQPSFDEYERPQVSFRLNGLGAELFAAVTQKNVGRLFAIVLDGSVVSAPQIRGPIPGGQGVIQGNFSLKEAQDLSLLMRAGALPAPLKVLEERLIGPGLGADSIQKGTLSTVLAIVLVVMIMFAAYSVFAGFANVALLVNLVLLMGGMAYFGATLTLPGIAGIALTLGMAVDANVLINERIKEELRLGRSVRGAIDMGYQRAMTTIIDSNLTTLIGAFILYSFGTGPVRGFAVTLSMGILISMFTAVLLSRALVFLWFAYKRPQTLWL